MHIPVVIKEVNKKSRLKTNECICMLSFSSTSKLLNSLTNRDFATRYIKDGWMLYYLPLDTVEKVYCTFAKNYDGVRNKFPSVAALHYKPQDSQTHFDDQGILFIMILCYDSYNIHCITQPNQL